MGRFTDLTGQKFGRLIPIKYLGNYKYLCICDCGKEKIIYKYNLTNVDTKSCGCLNIERISEMGKSNKIHGHDSINKRSKIYQVWAGMKQRCNDKNMIQYKDYGGRGIKICKRWQGNNGFINFLKDMGLPPTPKHQLDRIDNNRGYNKNNCRWATRKEQSRNRRSNRIICFHGKKQCLSAWAEEYNIKPSTLSARINLYKWSIKKALSLNVI